MAFIDSVLMLTARGVLEMDLDFFALRPAKIASVEPVITWLAEEGKKWWSPLVSNRR